jgi:hypothetical protein
LQVHDVWWWVDASLLCVASLSSWSCCVGPARAF